MGIFDFIRNVGRKPEPPKDDDKDEQLEELRMGNAILRTLLAMELPVEKLKVSYDDGTATITGTAPDQATREKVVLVAGNTHGVARVDDQMEVVAPAPQATFYTVVSGDTLGGIAKAHYGNAAKYPVIFEANKPMLENPDRIYPGQVLRIPPL